MFIRYGPTAALNDAEIELLDDGTVGRGRIGAASNPILTAARARIAVLDTTGATDSQHRYMLAKEVFRELAARSLFAELVA